jgi:hypothetical protein
LGTLQFSAVILTALTFVPVGAHLFEMPNKLGLFEEHYFVVQSIYRGWALFGIVILAAIITNLLVATMLWREGRVIWPNLAAGLILAATLLVFFAWTYPANVATDNWTVMPTNWEGLRAQWELSHAANAILAFVALCCAALSGTINKSA